MSAESGILLGLEEEVFITEPTLPSVASLWHLARLFWSRPSYYYTHSASNFARGKDLGQGIMSGVEISTGIHSTPDDLVRDLAARRRELAEVSGGLVVATGHLFDIDAPTNTCGMHIHVGPVDGADLERVYSNLARFLPLLSLLTASSPLRRGQRFGQSYRMARSYAIGPLRKDDKKYRFQDMIVSKRLGTIELRIFDPVWDLERVRVLAACIQAVAAVSGSARRFSWDERSYAEERHLAATQGYAGSLRRRYAELREIVDVPEELFARTVSDELYECWRRHGTLVTYVALDRAYRHGTFDPEWGAAAMVGRSSVRTVVAGEATAGGAGARLSQTGAFRVVLGSLRGLAGFVCYYVPKLPYIIVKGLKEH